MASCESPERGSMYLPSTTAVGTRDEVARIAGLVGPVCVRYPFLIRLYLFGSRARGSHREMSDYDLYAELDYSRMGPKGEYLSLIDELQGVLHGYVDFISGDVWNARDVRLKHEIDRDRELLYDRDAQ